MGMKKTGAKENKDDNKEERNKAVAPQAGSSGVSATAPATPSPEINRLII